MGCSFFLPNLGRRQALEQGIDMGRGGLILKLTPEQYAQLKKRGHAAVPRQKAIRLEISQMEVHLILTRHNCQCGLNG